MPKHEGKILKNKLKGTGKKTAEIASMLDMSRQNVNYHLAKPVLDPDFKRLVKEKSMDIFQVENVFDDEENVKDFISQRITIKDAPGSNQEYLIRLLSKVNVLFSNEAEKIAQKEGRKVTEVLREMDKAAMDEANILYKELQKKQ